MTRRKLDKLIIYLKKIGYQIYGPTKENNEILIKQIKKPSQLLLDNRLPLYSFKEFFLPPNEVLFYYKNNNFQENLFQKSLALFGLSVFDLKALLLFRQVFEKDFYFQERFKNILIIGFGPSPFINGQFKIWRRKYEEDVLEHLQFDLFLIKRGKDYQVFTGTRLGQKILDKFGYQNYEHIQFTGYLKEEGLEPYFIEIKEKIKKMTPNHPFWQELAQRCIECGKCSIVCPTCFCFDIKDELISKNKGKRIRYWTSCFYHNFSEIAGGKKFLNTTAERIYFWYYHKFVRLLDEYSFPGCVGCGRCSQVCPVGIDVIKNLQRIKNI
ncbi:MAG: 4Fe-4S dicluster domain-containing protein [Patescibacteria group bacterium]